MERMNTLASLPDLCFKEVLKYMRRKDILSLSVVSSAVRERVRLLSDCLHTLHFEDISPEELWHVGNDLPKIKGLCCNEITESQLTNIIEYLLITHPELESFTVKSSPISDSTFHSLISHKRMKYLFLCGIQITGSFLDPQYGMYENLNTLKLFKANHITDAKLESLLKVAPNLTALTLFSAPITGELSSNISGPLKLEKLKLLECFGVTEVGVCTMLKYAPGLISLDIKDSKVTGEQWKYLQPLTRLESLILSECKYISYVTEKGVAAMLSKAPNLQIFFIRGALITYNGLNYPMIKLKRLKIQDCREIQVDGVISTLKQAPNLTSLHLSKGTLTRDFRCETSLVQLKSLILSDLEGSPDFGLSSILGNSPNLRYLKLEELKINDDGLEFAEPLMNLTTLILKSCPKMTGFAVSSILNKAPNLKFVEVYSLRVSEDSLKCLSPLMKLESLDLKLLDITDVGLSLFLGKTQNLRSLYLNWLENISGEELSLTAPLTKLESVHIMNCGRVTSQGANKIHCLAPNMQRMVISEY